jgi:hypothetical protein
MNLSTLTIHCLHDHEDQKLRYRGQLCSSENSSVPHSLGIDQSGTHEAIEREHIQSPHRISGSSNHSFRPLSLPPGLQSARWALFCLDIPEHHPVQGHAQRVQQPALLWDTVTAYCNNSTYVTSASQSGIVTVVVIVWEA